MKNSITRCGMKSMRGSRGFSLMEVLVAMLVLAIGLLGLASLQAQSLKFNHEAYVRSQSTILAYEIMDKVRAAAPGTNFPALNGTNTAGCDPDVLAAAAYVLAVQDPSPTMAMCFWLLDLQTRLPSGTGNIAVNAVDNTLLDVTLQWSDREYTNAADCAAAQRTFIGGTCMISQSWTVKPRQP